jgi:phage-related tail fiber protein
MAYCISYKGYTMKRLVYALIAACSINVANAQTPGTTIGGVYTTTAPTLSDKQTGILRLDTKGRLIQTVEKRATYSAAVDSVVLAAAATDVFCVRGSATKTVIIKHITFAGTATATTAATMLLIKRSTLNTGGTSATATNVPHDSTNAAAAATVVSYTANPTLGTAVGNVDATKFALAAATAQVNERARQYGLEEDQGIVLNAAAESVCLNFNGQTVAGASVSVAVEWREIAQ